MDKFISKEFNCTQKISINRYFRSTLNNMFHLGFLGSSYLLYKTGGSLPPVARYLSVSSYIIGSYFYVKTCPSFLTSKHSTLEFLRYLQVNNDQANAESYNALDKFQNEFKNEINEFNSQYEEFESPLDVLEIYVKEMN